MAYIGKSPTGSGVRQRYVYTATGGETSLSGADDNSKTLKFTDGEYVDVHLNGVLLVQGTDYGVGTANTISSLAALAANDVVEITVYDVYNVAKINSEAMRNRWYFTATGGETSITTSEVAGLSFNANAEIEVRLNGVSLQQGVDFNTTTANQVGGLAALTAGQVVEIIHYADFQLADTVSKAAGGTFTGDVTIDNNLNVGTIKNETGTTTAITIDSSGDVAFPQRYPKVALIADVKSANTAGGTFTAGSWQDRDLNTEIYDPDGIVSISSNEFTLGAGTYIIEWECVYFDVGINNTRLYDVTGSASVQAGMSSYGNPPDNGYGFAPGSAQVTPTASNTYKIQHRCSTTKSSTGFGLATNVGEDEQYVRVKITKIA